MLRSLSYHPSFSVNFFILSIHIMQKNGTLYLSYQYVQIILGNYLLVVCYGKDLVYKAKKSNAMNIIMPKFNLSKIEKISFITNVYFFYKVDDEM